MLSAANLVHATVVSVTGLGLASHLKDLVMISGDMLWPYGFDLFSAVACETLDSLTIYFLMSSEGKQLFKI